MTSTNISVTGDRLYVAAIRALSEKRAVTQAELVRAALDAIYGEELKPLLAFFYASNGTSNVPLARKSASRPKRKE